MIARLIGPLLIFTAVLGSLGEYYKFEFPTVRFPFTLCREIPLLRIEYAWITMALLFIVGCWFTVKLRSGFRFTPMTQRRIERFKSIRRGYFSLIIIGLLIALASLDHLVVGNEALAVKKSDGWVFPALTRQVEKGKDFGLEGDAGEAPADYRKLKEQLKDSESVWILMPLIPFAPTGDTVPAVSTGLDEVEGKVMKGSKIFSGLGAQLYDTKVPERMHLRFRYRKGLRDGPADGWDRQGNRVYGAKYESGQLVDGSESWNGQGEVNSFLRQVSSSVRQVHYPPSPPTSGEGQTHLLGTNSRGYDVVAYLFGGLQVNF